MYLFCSLKQLSIACTEVNIYHRKKMNTVEENEAKDTIKVLNQQLAKSHIISYANDRPIDSWSCLLLWKVGDPSNTAQMHG